MKLGDIIFQDLPKIPIGLLRLVELIFNVQGNKGPEHCGICTGFFLGMPLITEAFIFGVWTIPFPLFIIRWPFGLKTKSWDMPVVIPGIVAWVKSKKGAPYNIHFSDSDNAYYCTSLIAKAYAATTAVYPSCTKTIKQVELTDPPGVTLYQKILGSTPDPICRIWLVSDLMNTKELV